ncbi:MAG: NAD(+)/NADH kinase [Alphaproteobacteria bacterium]|nr:NAD(+)/NADH kinase [Alphaproteobacteria bacterium]
MAVVINRRAGAVRREGADRVAQAFRTALGTRLCYLHIGTGRDVAEAVRRARDEGAHCILSIGGDGTCTAVAEMARAGGFIASALPGGTKNILARRLWGEEATLFEIAERCGAGRVKLRHMDAGDANGRLFFVGASFGLIPHLARAREKLRGRAEPSGFFAALRHVLRLGRRGLFQPRVAYARPGKDTHRCAALMVSVKSIDEVLRRPGGKDDPASFDCAAASPQGWWQLVWLGLRAVFTDTWRDHAAIDVFNVPALDVNGPSRLVVALDGEAIVLAPPVRLTMLQDAIPMLGADGSRPAA